ncbi:hypothetical protein [Encephalitozoon cuniculi GB-M1]|uniref:Uncharacterized protein n=1 Tax=Encephalitozoon cuniculi (strain GB-M1) TaxID=284813 RepID=Q8SWB9_ENCCU|nr:uncharacterized protein ECU02_1000 [Encephalitozoon cuniculi GB-M1]CAD25129.1 hypothetical protein [Encephalitozoon cuniculi GB-M1]
MDFIAPSKQKELRSALEKVRDAMVVVCGPPGSSKTYSIEKTAHSLGLSVEYIEDIGMYRNMLPTRNTICLTDLDGYEHLSKHRKRLERMRNLVIETRTLLSIGKMLPNVVTVNFGKVSNRKIQKFYGLSDAEALQVDGNLHAIRLYKYSSGNEAMSIFHLLGRLFHSKAIDVSKAAERIGIYGRDRFIGYLVENCVSFMSVEDICRLTEGLSLSDLGDMHLEYLIWVVASSEKTGPKGFFSFRSFRGVRSEHVCSGICMNR